MLLEEKRLLDTRTGEVLSVERKMGNPSYWVEGGYLWRKKADSLKIFHDAAIGDMTDVEIAKLMRLVGHISSDNSIPLSNKRIFELIGLSHARGMRFLQSMQRKGKIKRDKVEGEWFWFVSPAIVFGGRILQPRLYYLFRKELGEMVSESARGRFDEILRREGWA